MPAISTAIAAVGMGLQIAGVAKSVAAAKGAAEASQQAIAFQQQAEGARQQQMRLDANRKRRESIRAGLAQRSVAQANATAQGAQLGSGLQGGYGQISGTMNRNVQGVSQGEELGNTIFNSNIGAQGAYSRQASYQSQGALGAGLSSLGGSMITNIQPLTRIGDYVFNNYDPKTQTRKF